MSEHATTPRQSLQIPRQSLQIDGIIMHELDLRKSAVHALAPTFLCLLHAEILNQRLLALGPSDLSCLSDCTSVIVRACECIFLSDLFLSVVCGNYQMSPESGQGISPLCVLQALLVSFLRPSDTCSHPVLFLITYHEGIAIFPSARDTYMPSLCLPLPLWCVRILLASSEYGQSGSDTSWLSALISVWSADCKRIPHT